MRRISTDQPHRFVRQVLVAGVLMVMLQATGYAQTTQMREFVLFGANSAQIGTSTIITSNAGGRIGSYKLVRTIGNTNVTATINSDDLVQLNNSNTIRGNITAGNQSRSTGVVFSAGSNFSFPNTGGEIHVNGKATVQSGSVKGTVYVPQKADYSGPQPKAILTNPVFPTLPQLPLISSFPTGTQNNIPSNGLLQPNTNYGDLVLTGSKTVTFNGPGVYTFKSIRITNSGNQFILDFKLSKTDFIIIQVREDADLDKLNVQLANGGDASRVYTEVHGTGASSPNGTEAWRIANGSSGSTGGIWYGTVWAPNGDIFVGQGSSPSKIEGSLWSGKNVSLASGVSITHVPIACPPPVATAGADQTIQCPATQTTIGTTSSTGVYFKWTTLVNGQETVVGTQRTLTVSNAGAYKLTATNACGQAATDEVIVGYKSCLEPINPNTGKVENVIGHELTYLTTNFNEAKKHLIVLDNNEYVLIEAVAVVGKEQAAKDLLIGLGMKDLIPTGLAYQIISGKFPIAKLTEINKYPLIINHCRPVFLPNGNAGTVTTEGDRAMASNLARGGFNVAGEGIKIGVISDSYNRSELGVDRAQLDVSNGDLPGVGNPDGNVSPVQVISEYPYGQRSDEGRAMLQIIHDVAPKAQLAFATGFVSAGHMAQNILDLQAAGCKVIVDDVTYPVEPFFQDGIIARTVNTVNSRGVTYFTSAGNFGQKSYSSTFSRAPAPAGLGQHAHDFGGGDIYQRLKLKSGTYSIVLQWKDNIYSLAQTTGTVNDLDIYLVDQGGRIGFNRNNVGGDPFEVLSFSVNLSDPSQEIDADLLITKADNSTDNPLIKYIIFRGEAVIAEYYSGQALVDKSTIVGHANASGAITVGAVLFSNTAPFGRTPTIASFSSSGGTPVFAAGSSTSEVRGKPELVAPNGVNTARSVAMGPDIDFIDDPVNGRQDGFPNFFGTSASAPHAAAAAALVLEARKKFYNQVLTPDALRLFLFNSALAMQPDGIVGSWNYKAGYGLVQPNAAIRSFANPLPKINQLVYDANIVPGTTPFTLRVEGEYLSDNSVIYFRGAPITTVRVNSSTLEATIPAFGDGNPPIAVYTPSFPGATGDGGLSNNLYFFTPVKLKVEVKADNKEMKYGEVLPTNSFSVFVQDKPLAVYNQENGKSLTIEKLGLSSVQLQFTVPNVNPLSNSGDYRIDAVRPFDQTNPIDVGLLELYEYKFTPGLLTINKLAVTISPADFTVGYGDPITNVQFNYQFDPNANIASRSALLAAIKAAHAAHVDNSVLGVMNSTGGSDAVFFQGQMLPVYNNAAIIYQNKLYPIVSGTNGKAVVIIQGVQYPVENRTGGAVVILNAVEYPVINGGGAVVIINGQILPVVINRTGSAVVILNGTEYPIQNRTGGAVVILNGQEYPVINGGGGAVVIINGQYLPVVNNRITGSAVVILNGLEYPVFNSLRSGGAAVILNGEEYPVVNSVRTAVTILNGTLYDVELNRATGGAAVLLNGVVQESNVPYLNGKGGSAAVIINGQYYPVINRSIGGAVVILNGQEYPVVNRSIGGAAVILNGQEYQVVNSISKTTLTNMSTSATLNAIANARSIQAQPNKFIDVAANAFVQFNTNSSQSTLLNTFATVNARTLVDANRLANSLPVVVNTRTTAVTILNGSGAYVNSGALSLTGPKTPVVVDAADLNSTSSVATISMQGINMLTGISSGEQFIIPATLYSSNFNIKYEAGTVNITKAPLALKANDLTKEFGKALSINQAAFGISSGNTKYKESIALANIASTGAAANAGVGSYPITINNAMGSYGTDADNYNIVYSEGTLSVIPRQCPVIVHSPNTSFVNTRKEPVSLWLNLQIKVRGQLARANDSLVFRGGLLKLENVDYQRSADPIPVPTGVVIATAGVTTPITYFDAERGAFITRVPVGFNSTADIFITGAIINSNIGFTKSKSASSVLSGIFQSNVTYNGQWNYSMAAYLPFNGTTYVDYSQLTREGSVVAMSSGYKAGTPMPWLSQITAGGSGNGGSNYTGSPTNNDNFTSCVVAVEGTVSNQRYITAVESDEEMNKALASDKDLLVFPNPASSFVIVSFVPQTTGNATLKVFNALGAPVKELYQGVAETGKIYTRRIETHSWAKGVYIVQLVVNKQIITRKLVISP